MDSPGASMPVGAEREATAGRFRGSRTRWTGRLGEHEDGFAGVGLVVGSL